MNQYKLEEWIKRYWWFTRSILITVLIVLSTVLTVQLMVRTI